MIIPKGLLALWAPLLEQLRARHPAISVMLVQTITTRLVGTPAPDENGIPGKVDPSYEHCLAAWAAWMVDTWSQDDVSRADTVAWLLRGLGSVTTQRESGSA
jgi:ribosomal biogenesis protein LAS1